MRKTVAYVGPSALDKEDTIPALCFASRVLSLDLEPCSRIVPVIANQPAMVHGLNDPLVSVWGG